MKVSEQAKVVKSGFDNSTHSFFALVARALQQKLQQDAGVELAFIGKSSTGKGEMSGVLTAQVIEVDPKKAEETLERVKQTMAGLKNPTDFVDLLKKG